MRWLVPPAVVLLLVVIVRALLIAPFSIPTGSMEPTLEVGDRILVNRTVNPPELGRGDIVVFDAAQAFGLEARGAGLVQTLVGAAGSLIGAGPETDYVKRVIGLPGDHVVCCGPDGRVAVNGAPVDEPYVYPGDEPSSHPFDVTVPDGSLWVMGDHRSRSADSRAYLGRPGGGMVPMDDVIGKVWVRYWPPDRVGSIGSAHRFSTPRNGT
ncbi:MAG: signal peptidase I [Micrococcales bacterium]|nr:signal peptidase I [Micrococcales bacterium]